MFLFLQESSYKPQVEAISPTLPSDDSTKDESLRKSKEVILSNIHRIDREITKVDNVISKLRKNQVFGCFYLWNGSVFLLVEWYSVFTCGMVQSYNGTVLTLLLKQSV